MRQETFTLSAKELQRVAVISHCVKGDLACAGAAELLDLSPRHVKRLKARYRQGGEAAMAHASRGRPSPHCLPEQVRALVGHLPGSPHQRTPPRLPAGSREANLTLTTDNGTQFTSSRFLETLGRLGITHRRTAYHHPEGNSYIERFHRSLKEEEVWTAEYRSLEEARASIARWIEEYNHDRPHRGVQNRTPHEAFLAFAGVLKNEALNV